MAERGRDPGHGQSRLVGWTSAYLSPEAAGADCELRSVSGVARAVRWGPAAVFVSDNPADDLQVGDIFVVDSVRSWWGSLWTKGVDR